MKIAQAPANAAKCSEAQRPKDSLGYPVNGFVSVTSRTHISGLTNCHVIKITNMAAKKQVMVMTTSLRGTSALLKCCAFVMISLMRRILASNAE